MVVILTAMLLAATPDLSADLSLRSETRTTRLLTEGPLAGEVSRISTEVTPLGALAVEARDWRLRLSYAPRLWSPDLDRARLDVDHQADLRGEGNPLPQWNLAIGATATRGLIDPLANLWTSLGPPAATPVNINSDQPLLYWSYRGAVESLYHLNPSSSISTAASAGYSAGVGQGSQVVPPQRMFTGSLGYLTFLDPRNRLGLLLSVDAARTFFSGALVPVTGTAPSAVNPPQTSVTDSGDLGITANWRRQLNPYLTGTAAAGADYLLQTTSYFTRAASVTPVGSIGAEWVSDRNRPGLALRAQLGYAPLIDRITGQIRKSVVAATRCEWPVTLDTSFSVGLESSAQIQTVDPAFLSAEFRVSRRMGDAVQVALGARALRQTETKALLQQVTGTSITFANTTIAPNYTEESIFLDIEWLAYKSTRGLPPQGAR